MPFPDSVQALIAARLDTLAPERNRCSPTPRSWQGLLGRRARRDGRPRPRAWPTRCASSRARSSCARRGAPRSRGEAEYAFWHVLARDVAYAQLPRASRAARHVAAATWIESKAAERVEDLADVLAYHYATALELARAAGQAERGGGAGGTGAEVPHPGRRARARPGHGRGARRTSSGRSRSRHPGTPSGPRRSPASARPPCRPDATPRRRRRSRRRSRRSGHGATSPPPPEAMATSPGCSSRLGDPRQWTLPAEALALLEPLRPAPELVGALTEVAATETIHGRSETAIRLRRTRPRPRRGARAAPPGACPRLPGTGPQPLGDAGGLDDLREAIELATEAGQGREVAAAPQQPRSGLLGVRRSCGLSGGHARGDRLRAVTRAHRDARLDDGRARSIRSSRSASSMRRSRSPRPRRALEQRGRARPDGRRAARAGPDPRHAGRGRQSRRLLDWLESSRPGDRGPPTSSSRPGATALARVALGQDEPRGALLAEVEADTRCPRYAELRGLLPAMVRTALASASRRLPSGS